MYDRGGADKVQLETLEVGRDGAILVWLRYLREALLRPVRVDHGLEDVLEYFGRQRLGKAHTRHDALMTRMMRDVRVVVVLVRRRGVPPRAVPGSGSSDPLWPFMNAVTWLETMIKLIASYVCYQLTRIAFLPHSRLSSSTSAHMLSAIPPSCTTFEIC